MMPSMKPAVFRQRNYVQLSYELPHHIRSSALYPVRSPNGSRIIICGHEEGLRVIWYGGRSYKSTTTDTISEINGNNKDEPMVIDLSDDDETAPALAEKVEFEDEEDEIDTAEPYRHVLRYIDISLGTMATHIAVPHISPSQGESISDSHAPILSSHIIVAAACLDHSIRLVTLPLTPPARSSDDVSAWNTEIIQIPATNGHQDFLTSISITDFAEAHDDGTGGGGKSKSRSRSGARVTSKPSTEIEWSFLIASTSCTGGGLLLIHRIPLLDHSKLDQSPESLAPAQRQLLRSPLSACKLSFNPSPHPADRASNLLITLPDSGSVKVYQVTPHSTHVRGRRESGATMESTTSSTGSTRKSVTQQGKFLITLYSTFVPPREGEPFGRRKRPLDASWVLGGRAILALLEDGEWGVWDLEAAGPPSAGQTQNLVKGQSSVSGIQGGSLTKFTVRGTLAPHANEVGKSKSDNPDTIPARGLAPATPHTRKSRSDQLFEGRGSQMNFSDTISRGNLCVTEIPPALLSLSSKTADESVLFTYGTSTYYLPSLITYWRTEVSGRGTFGISSSAKPTSLPSLRLGGDPLKATYQFSQDSNVESALESVSLTPDTLTVTDQKAVLLLVPLSESTLPKVEYKQSLSTQLYGRHIDGDALLLERGELGIDGLDNMLDDMTNGKSRSFGKSVGFNTVEDMDVDMRASLGTPTPKVTGRLGSGKSTPRVAFRSGQAKTKLFS